MDELCKPAVVMVVLQLIYAGLTLSTRAALRQGLSSMVFVVYRQAIATLLISPVACFTRRKSSRSHLGWKSFSLIFLASLIGVTINQNIYFEGLYLSSSSIASATANLVPAITFVMASAVGLEKVSIRSLRSIAKIIGTAICVSGAVAMALLRGPKLLNTELIAPARSLFDYSSGGEDWLLGCLFLFGSNCCWSLWLILQVPMSASYQDHISLTAWMCFLSTIQSAIVTFFLEPDPQTWHLSSYLELGALFYAGISSAVTFFAQSWCISKRGPLFSALFSPLSTVVVTLFACIFQHEEIYTGSLIGAFGVIMGLYVVLWGKAKDLEEVDTDTAPNSENDQTMIARVLIDESSSKNNLEEPLLSEFVKSTKADENQIDF